MTSISIIGSGNMVRAIGALAVKGGNTVEVISRDANTGGALAGSLGNSATTGTWGTTPTGDIIILTVLFAGAVPVVTKYGAEDTSIAQMVTEAIPASTQVVKAFNILFSHVIAAGNPVDVFMAGDHAQAKASVSAFITSLGLRPRAPVTSAWRTGWRTRVCWRWARPHHPLGGLGPVSTLANPQAQVSVDRAIRAIVSGSEDKCSDAVSSCRAGSCCRFRDRGTAQTAYTTNCGEWSSREAVGYTRRVIFVPRTPASPTLARARLCSDPGRHSQRYTHAELPATRTRAR